MALTLMKKNKYIYIPAAVGNQSVYKPYSLLSRNLQNCLRHDFSQGRFEENNISAADLAISNEYSLTAGFFLAQLKGETNYSTISISSLRDYCKSSDKIICVLIDECQSLARVSKSHLKLVRNLLRGVGIVVVLLGTSSVAANLVEVGKISRGSATWANIFTKFPKYCFTPTIEPKKSGTTHFDEFASFVNSEVNTRGWFLDIAREFSSSSIPSNIHILDSFRTFLRNQVISQKASIMTDISGQIAMLMPSYYKNIALVASPSPPPQKKQKALSFSPDPGYLLSKHFALFRTTSKSFPLENTPHWIRLTENQQLFLDDMSDKWIPDFWYQSPPDDNILHLCFPPSQGFFSESSPITTQQAFSSLLSSITIQNSIVKSTDGDVLEAISTTILTVSSRLSVKGISFQGFLQRICAEWGEILPTNFSLFPSDILGEIIPFFSPPNSCWSQKLASFPECNFGFLVRPPNSSQLDILGFLQTSKFKPESFQEFLCCGDLVDETKLLELGLELKISGECKDREKLGEIGEILRRIPKSSTMHLVFCRQLPASAFATKKNTYATFLRQYPHLQSANILKYNNDGNFTEFDKQRMPLLPKPTKVVIFFENH